MPIRQLTTPLGTSGLLKNQHCYAKSFDDLQLICDPNHGLYIWRDFEVVFDSFLALSGYLDPRLVRFDNLNKTIYVSHGEQDMVVPYAWDLVFIAFEKCTAT